MTPNPEIINNRIEFSVDKHIAHVQLARPEKLNSLDPKMFDALIAVGAEISETRSIRVVVISAQGDHFCAGLDKSNFESLMKGQSAQMSEVNKARNFEQRIHGVTNTAQQVAWQWRELSVPVIVALQGVIYGGGLQIALGADIRFASPNSEFSVMEIKWGLIPDMAGTQLMRHLMSEDRVKELTYTGRTFSAEQAVSYGMVTDIFDDPVEQAFTVAELIANKNPDAIQASKRVLNAASSVSVEEGLLMESIEQDKLIGTKNQLEAVMAELQKRAPNFED